MRFYDADCDLLESSPSISLVSGDRQGPGVIYSDPGGTVTGIIPTWDKEYHRICFN